MQDFTKKVNEFKNFEYIRRYKKNGKVVDEKQTMGISGVLGAATDNFWYKSNDALLLPLAADTASSAEGGVFLPDNVFSDKRFLDAMRDRGFSDTQIADMYDGISNVYAEYVNKPLVEQKEEER